MYSIHLLAAAIVLLHLNPNVFALTVHDDTVQAVLSKSDNFLAPLNAVWEEVDISEGWADPRINGGRLLDVSRPSVICSATRNSVRC